MSEPERPPIADFMEMAKVEMASFAGSVVSSLCEWIEHLEAENTRLKAENESLSQRVIGLSASVAELQKEKSIQSSLAEALAENERLKAELVSIRTYYDLATTIPCPDCDGTGYVGTAQNGKKIACEKCGGSEDRLGDGVDRAYGKLHDEIAALKAELDNRTNGRWSADQVELTRLRGIEKFMQIVKHEDEQLRKDLRWLLDGAKNDDIEDEIRARLAAIEERESHG